MSYTPTPSVGADRQTDTRSGEAHGGTGRHREAQGGTYTMRHSEAQ